MMIDTHNTIQEIYARLLAQNYQDTLFADLQAKKDGKEKRGRCPFCKGHNFSYSSREPLWRCFNCGKAGDWIKYLELRSRLSFGEALQELARPAGIELEGHDQAKYQAYVKKADLLETAQALFRQTLWEPAGQPVLQYLQDRGYTEQEIMEMGLGAYAGRAGLQEQLLQQGYTEQEIKGSGLLTRGLGESHQLSLLWIDPAGRATGLAVRSLLSREDLKARGLPPYLYSAGLQKSQGLIGLSSARGESTVLLLEGLLDALYINAKGLKYRALAIGGTDLSLAQIKSLEANGTKELILALDTDEPGQAGTEKALRLLSSSKMRAYVIPDFGGLKDPDELVRAHGPEALQQAIRAAQRSSAWLARRIISRHDLSSAMGLDQALEEALEAYARIEDGIEARAFWDSLRDATGLSEDDLQLRARENIQKVSQRASQRLLDGLIKGVQEKASQGDIIGAELALSEGLQQLKGSRGVIAPEPYLSGDFLEDIQLLSQGLTTGYSSLDRIARIPEGAISMIAGRPGHGKTTMLLNLFLNMIRAYPEQRFYLFSYEEARSRLALKILMAMAGEVFQGNSNQGAYIHYLREKRLQEKNKKIEDALREYQQLTVAGRLTLSDQRLSGEDLAATISLLARRGDTGAIFVDYIQRIPIQRQLSQRYLEIKLVSDLLLEQAVRHNLPVIVGAQFNRAGGGSGIRLEHLREAGDLEQDAHLVLGLYNESVDKIEEGQQEKGREVELKVSALKNRSGLAGSSLVLSFDRPILRITDKGSQGPW